MCVTDHIAHAHLPPFFLLLFLLRLMRGSLRTEPQGADTIVWLAASTKGGESTGKYFFDRKARWTNLLFANTKPEKKDYGDLVAFCEGKCPVGEGEK